VPVERVRENSGRRYGGAFSGLSGWRSSTLYSHEDSIEISISPGHNKWPHTETTVLID